eukprot:COSAG06_NODE_41347_length_392_cov_0.914676_1_plen_34_part_10
MLSVRNGGNLMHLEELMVCQPAQTQHARRHGQRE